MKAAVLRAPGGLDRIEVHDIPDPGQPGPGQIRIALHASSLNYHDLLVANGGLPTADRRVLMSDGAGVVEAVGEGIAEFRPGDHVVSCFFPQWQDGPPSGPVGDLADTPGDGIDGFAAHFSVRAATAFTRAPRGWSHAEAATITTGASPPGGRWSATGKSKPVTTSWCWVPAAFPSRRCRSRRWRVRRLSPRRRLTRSWNQVPFSRCLLMTTMQS